MNISQHMLTALRSAVQQRYPFPHFVANNVFPTTFYNDVLLPMLAQKDDYEGVEGRYANRTFANGLVLPELDFMSSKEFFGDVLRLFPEPLRLCYGGTNQRFTRDVRLIRDCQHYKIGPHTDITKKVISLLFYLPPDDSLRDYGTVIYHPKPHFQRDPDDTRYGRHYDFDDFDELARVPFLPNTCLGFWRTDWSWHGVPPIPDVVRRDVLLYNIYTANPKGDGNAPLQS